MRTPSADRHAAKPDAAAKKPAAKPAAAAKPAPKPAKPKAAAKPKRRNQAGGQAGQRQPAPTEASFACRSAALFQFSHNASIARSRLPSAAALLNTAQNKAIPADETGTNQRGNTMERIWLKQYPAGVPADIDVTQYASLVELLEESFAKFADRKAFICMDKSITYRELDEMSRRSAPSCRARACRRARASR